MKNKMLVNSQVYILYITYFLKMSSSISIKTTKKMNRSNNKWIITFDIIKKSEIHALKLKPKQLNQIDSNEIDEIIKFRTLSAKSAISTLETIMCYADDDKDGPTREEFFYTVDEIENAIVNMTAFYSSLKPVQKQVDKN